MSARYFTSGGGFEAALEVVDNGQEAGEHLFGTVAQNLGLFLDHALAEVVEIGHEEEVFLLLFLHGCACVVELLLERFDALHLFVRFFSGFLGVGLRHFLHRFGNFGLGSFRLRLFGIIMVVFAHILWLLYVCLCKNAAKPHGRGFPRLNL